MSISLVMHVPKVIDEGIDVLLFELWIFALKLVGQYRLAIRGYLDRVH